MNPQERAVIDGIFERLRNVANQPRDAEVERYITDLVRQQPYAPYAMAQSIYVQEQALLNQQREIEQLQAEVAQMQQQMQPPAPQSGGFLSGIFGGGAQQQPRSEPPAYGQRGAAQAMAAQPPQAGPWGGQPQQPAGPWAQQPPQKQGMGFLGTAASAAAGVAGGMMLGSILSNAFGGGHANAAQGGLGLGNSGLVGQTPSQSQGMSTQGAEPEVEDDGYEDDSDDSSDDGYDDGGGSDSYDV